MPNDPQRLHPHRQPVSARNRVEVEQPPVLIVDGDVGIREALQELMLSVEIDSICFVSTRDLLYSDVPDRPAYLILDVRMPGSSGLDLQTHLAINVATEPVIFLLGTAMSR